jgi:hypothetical protein
MPLRIGDIVHSEITNEEGLIVRILEIEGRISYIVAIVNKVSGKELEAFWRPWELKELSDDPRKYESAQKRTG